jgi:hypothetical protein
VAAAKTAVALPTVRATAASKAVIFFILFFSFSYNFCCLMPI